MTGNRRPTFVVDAAIAEHFKILRFVALCRLRVIEAVGHAHALHWNLTNAVHDAWLWQLGGLKDGRRYIDEVVELMPNLSFACDALWPMHNRSVAGAAPI